MQAAGRDAQAHSAGLPLSVPVSSAEFTRVKQPATKKREQMNWTSVAAKADGTAAGKFISARIKGG
jgi:hypothetical protein